VDPAPSAARRGARSGSGELKRRLGAISTKTLTERLRMLEAEGWLTRHYVPDRPPQVTYAVTERVLELDGVMSELDRIASAGTARAGSQLRREHGALRSRRNLDGEGFHGSLVGQAQPGPSVREAAHSDRRPSTRNDGVGVHVRGASRRSGDLRRGVRPRS